MKAIFGLGNVGEKYALTRHNVGFLTLDKLAQIYKLEFSSAARFRSELAKNSELVLAKPTTMMNSSGDAVLQVCNYYKISSDNLYIVHDDLDIALGEYKIQRGRGPKVHNGVNSVEEKFGSVDFWRVRIGVDNRDPENRTPGEKYALDMFEEVELGVIDGVLNKVVKELSDVL